MLKRHSQFLVSSIVIFDVAVTCLAWFAAYWLRFEFQPLRSLHEHVPKLQDYLMVLSIMAPLTILANIRSKLYEPRRIANFGKEFAGIVRSTFTLIIAYLVLDFFLRESQVRISRTFLVFFAVINTTFMLIERWAVRGYLRRARARGQNLRYALIVGAGKVGQSLASAFRRNDWTGIELKGYLDHRSERQGMDIRGVNVLGGYSDLPAMIQDHNIDQVFLALPTTEQPLLSGMLEELDAETVDVFIVPDVLSYASLRLDTSNFDGLPIINLREHSVQGWNRVIKRGFDIGFSLAALVVTGIPMMIIAAAIKYSSEGPIFYTQERMGLDGQTFQMKKFRTMRQDAEQETGAVWASKDDPRRTALGTFLRKSSMDELPQFFNVLLGHMSVVGPRPERPVFIGEFKKTVPKYMLRHKMKAGITGWAQVNGWRGNTSLRKRIQFDLYYIENWSITFDLYIILMTVFKGIANKNAY